MRSLKFAPLEIFSSELFEIALSFVNGKNELMKLRDQIKQERQTRCHLDHSRGRRNF